jgi:hypothetical protein
MAFVSFLFAVFVASILTIIFVGGFRKRGPWANTVVFFAVVFLTAWAGGMWLQPLGPSLWGMYWVPFMFVGLLVALLLAAATPSNRPTPRNAAGVQTEKREKIATVTAIGTFFWIFLAALVMVIVISYLFRLHAS